MKYNNHIQISLRVKPTGKIFKSEGKIQHEVVGSKTINGITYKARGVIKMD